MTAAEIEYPCRCGQHERYTEECPLVDCDEPGCEALRDPQTTEELRAALEHWREHGYLAGCSHAR